MLTRRQLVAGMTLAPGFLGANHVSANLDLGNSNLTTVSDGSLQLPGSLVFDPMTQNELAPLLTEFGISSERLTPECNVTLYRDGNNTVLFDVGSGPDFAPTAGTLYDSLDAINVSPEDITHVIFTHAHPDHIWGLLDDFDEPLFYNASYYIGRTEWDYWWNPETVNSIGEARQSFAVGAKRRLEAVEDNVSFFDDGDEVLQGIVAVETPGHTPGHMAFEVGNNSSRAMVVGDAIGNHHVALRRPTWLSGSDQDQQRAAETRLRLLERITAEQMSVVGFHLPEGGIGRIEDTKDGYHFVHDT